MKIYDQHRAAFGNVSAHCIAKNGELVGTIAFKFPRDGAGRLHAYVHWHGIPMVRGFAGGYGYDKRSAACSDAARNAINAHKDDSVTPADTGTDMRRDFFIALRDCDNGDTWQGALIKAGFQVWSAV